MQVKIKESKKLEDLITLLNEVKNKREIKMIHDEIKKRNLNIGNNAIIVHSKIQLANSKFQ